MRSKTVLREKLNTLIAELGYPVPERLTIDAPKDPKFGDLATNAAMLLAKETGQKPRDLAEALKAKLGALCPEISKMEVAGPGFLNVFYAPSFWQGLVSVILNQKDKFGSSTVGQGKRVQVEYVSANPTGPLHIGHGRGAALGDSLGRILSLSGYEVSREYYINDAGRQMRLLGTSIFVRYQQQFGQNVDFPEDCYQGSYIEDLAKELMPSHGRSLLDMPREQAEDICYDHGMSRIMAGIKQDLKDFRVGHDVWFSEKSLVDSGQVEKTLAWLEEQGLAYRKDDALWFATTRYGDDKDRVLRKSDGLLTYFASDIAYHANKFKRGFDLLVDIWGADHHGYVPRMKAAVQALGKNADSLEVILVQLVNLLKDGQIVAMSTRAGKFETLADVVAEVGADSARYIFLSRKSDSHLDFDMDLVTKQSMDNPVYYVQYAHARICSVLRKAQESGLKLPEPQNAPLSRLDTDNDLTLLKTLDQFPDVVLSAAKSLSPHHVSFYLQTLANDLHRYYTINSILAAGDDDLVLARLTLMSAVAQVLRNGLNLLGVTASERM